MKRKDNKKKGSIFPKLLISYFFFSTIAIMVLFGSIAIVAFWMTDGERNALDFTTLVQEDGTLGDVSVVYRSGGWIEKLDHTYTIVEQYGEKKTKDETYTLEQLLEMTRLDQQGSEYRFFYQPFEGGSYLFCYPATSLSVTLNYDVNGVTTDKQQTVLMLFVLVFLFMDGILVSLYIYRKIRLPLKHLTDGMQRMENGERNFRLSFRADGEFMALQDAFHEMLAHIEREEKEKKTLQEEQNRMLLELSHDIKTPIATINNYAYALREGVVTQEEKDKYYQTILAKANRVSEMADDMFTMLKMESSEYQPQCRRFDFNEFLRQICAEYYDEVEQAGLRLDIEIPEDAIMVDGDEKLLHRVIGNLITNALKYNKAGELVEVKAYLREEQIVVIVADDGTRIEQELLPKLFSAFARGDKARMSNGGTGLGLAIAKAIVSKHDGAMFYQYENGRNEFVMILNLAG